MLAPDVHQRSVRSFHIARPSHAGEKDGDTGTAHLIAPSGLKVRQTRQARWLVLIIGLPDDSLLIAFLCNQPEFARSRLNESLIMKDPYALPEASSRNAMYEHTRRRFETDVVTVSGEDGADDEHL